MMTPEQIDAFQRDGAVVVRGVFADWIDVMAEGIAANMAAPGEFASENAVSEGRFFDDYCNWTRIPAFAKIVHDSPAAKLAAMAMRSQSAQFFHDHVLVKEPGTPKPTPWPMEPGDAVLFDFRTAHGARGNTAQTRRRALSLRWVGDDARYISRPGRTSPPFPGHGMTDGEKLREDWFPMIWKAE